VSMFTFGAKGDLLAYLGRRGQAFCVVSGSRRSQDYDEVLTLGFNEDGSTVSFDAREGADFWHVDLPLR